MEVYPLGLDGTDKRECSILILLDPVLDCVKDSLETSSSDALVVFYNIKKSNDTFHCNFYFLGISIAKIVVCK